ncbi:MAG: hypothetical protein KIT11_05470 [Fimbriimonadaceae bacterium]|nr:hypothetical protein [Fimbriimonadaceae bacterium]QYK56658.1 MAG: hypothetical protein KF733_04050 [Fimbriimonadaceae bacterium]
MKGLNPQDFVAPKFKPDLLVSGPDGPKPLKVDPLAFIEKVKKPKG